jgi:putative oxidoreductase
MRSDRTLLLLRLVAGGVFVVFGVGKFVNHASELASFRSYALPAPEVFVIVVGVIELVGGVLLIAGVLVRPAALALAGDMVGAVIVSGIAKGEAVSLTVAPAELVAMVVLLAAGAGRYRVSMAAGRGRPVAAPDRPRNRFAEHDRG